MLNLTEHLHVNYVYRREKELMKALETPEEKRARRLAKKVRNCCITVSSTGKASFYLSV